jgi:hypothetical protein
MKEPVKQGRIDLLTIAFSVFSVCAAIMVLTR